MKAHWAALGVGVLIGAAAAYFKCCGPIAGGRGWGQMPKITKGVS